MSELKPCPFCGGNAHDIDVNGFRFIACNDVRCNGVTRYHIWQQRPIEDALNKRIAELEAAQRWIPVGERLPEESGTYMVYYYYDNAYGSVWYSLIDAPFPDRVTHWRPLPEAPGVTITGIQESDDGKNWTDWHENH